MGEVRACGPAPGGGHHPLWIAGPPPLVRDLRPGDSVAVSGVCLTVVARTEDTFQVQVVPETLSRTSLGQLVPGDVVNLERALRWGDRLGGHLVLGHVDGVATVEALVPQGDQVWLEVSVPPGLVRYLPEKGFAALDGVSLTVAARHPTRHTVAFALIPETRARTTLGRLAVGQRLNLEVDPLARYLEALLEGSQPSSAAALWPYDQRR
jgi:riboflavin synthase alpha subunit